jgi:hypothetical protein
LWVGCWLIGAWFVYSELVVGWLLAGCSLVAGWFLVDWLLVGFLVDCWLVVG